MFDFTYIKDAIKKTAEWLKKEYSQISAGRANPQLLDSILVNSYGTTQPIKALATVSNEDPRTLRVAPWERDNIRAIETAIIDSGLPVSVSSDGVGVRVSVPQLTEETRKDLLKILKQKHEEARVSIRAERNKVEKDIESAEKEGEFSKDDRERYKKELQKLIDDANITFDAIYDEKEKSIMSI